MNPFCLAVYTEMRLHAKVSLGPLLRLMHLRIPLLRAILRRTGGTDDGRIHDGLIVHLQAVLRQMFLNSYKELFAQLVRFQEMPKLADRGLSGTGSQPRSMPTNCRMARESYSASSTAGSDRLNHCCRQWRRSMRSTPNRRTPRPLGLGRARFNRRHQVCPRYDTIHFVEEPLAASGFAILLEGAFSKGLLVHGAPPDQCCALRRHITQRE